MYPRISDLFSDLFGLDFPIPIYSFGAMVAIAVLTGAWLLRKEMDRYYQEGRMPAVKVSAPGGKEGGRRRGQATASPSVLTGNITVLAVVAGVVGAKLFHILDKPAAFASDPIGMIVSTGGFTFYGALAGGIAGLVWYIRRHALPVRLFFDALAPGLMLAYGVGRIGCHLAGDGDWGIASDLSAKPAWLPTWLWAETYPNNILNEYIPEPGVYPTPIYEFAMAAILFGVLWSLRRHPFAQGWLFSMYLVLAGIQRLIIEQIRVNVQFDLFGLTVTQAEVISVLIILLGIVFLALTTRRRDAVQAGPAVVAPQPKP
jgi:phosphatidylglycerol---prolipoprotein diacylglyceryl transferase